ncbi:hypothetical protein CA262_08100 [Sphingobium sp. GW456-12-10-14-TSB1]|uniref:hypothetical protein n=1 Tax=Sphingobium sp. GW456-12-10-14-TSB1 TaxID=1987165 RepID=UPI000A376DAA|nr:hypothetical protein [Sphingobium sp. GW456-12-10-14-TSB1]OUC56756.1 hypothetical protein CA262_08100 [Sphingobium sp. GW456-12-10-14-TSB1]
MAPLSPLRERLAGFPHAYACSIQRCTATGRNQFVVRTGDPVQPFRVTDVGPNNDENLVLRVA